jgi:hypothetical protein
MEAGSFDSVRNTDIVVVEVVGHTVDKVGNVAEVVVAGKGHRPDKGYLAEMSVDGVVLVGVGVVAVVDMDSLKAKAGKEVREAVVAAVEILELVVVLLGAVMRLEGLHLVAVLAVEEPNLVVELDLVVVLHSVVVLEAKGMIVA